MHDLKEVTEDVHYENFRTQLISKISQQALKDRGWVFRKMYSLSLLYYYLNIVDE
jgi:septin family protein